jgi:hypothetical protein
MGVVMVFCACLAPHLLSSPIIPLSFVGGGV